MDAKEEILELKRRHNDLEKRTEKIGKKQCSAIERLLEWLQQLVEEIESTHEKEKSLWNPAAITRMKLMKKGAKLSKELDYFDAGLAKEFEKGNISEDIVKRFVSIIRLIKLNKMSLAKAEFEYFEEIVELRKRYESASGELEKKDKILTREQRKIKNLLAEVSGLEKETVSMVKVRRYEEFLKNLKELEEVRETYLLSLISKPIAELLKDMEEHSIWDHCPDFPGKGEMAEFRNFFSEYPTLGTNNVSQLCEMFNYSEKKLSHICPETSKFKRIVLSNKKWFEILHALKQTTFLAVDGGNEKVMDFYAEKIEGAKKIVEQIRRLRKEKHSCKEEYEKCKRIEERKKELSKYSKSELDKELEDIESLLELLHSEPQDKVENKVEKEDLLSKIQSFFKI